MAFNANEDDLDAKAARDSLIAEARSIQKLLVDYQRSQEELQKDVNEFVQRDMEEEARGRQLYSTVALAELELCQNMDFLRFEKERGSKPDAVVPTRRMRETAGGGLTQVPSSTPQWSLGCIVAGGSAGGELQDHLPSAAVQLRDLGDLVEGLLGWRSYDNFEKEGAELCRRLFGAHRSASAALVCFSNGFPLAPAWLRSSKDPASNTRASQFLQQMTSTMKTELQRTPPAFLSAVAALVYQNTLFREGSMKEEELLDLLTEPHQSQDTTPAFPYLTGDPFDNIAVVECARLVDTQLFRGFFFMGELRVVEHLGAEVDMRGVLSSESHADLPQLVANKAEAATREQKRLQRTFREAYAHLSGSNRINVADAHGRTLNNRNISIILAVSREALRNDGRNAAPHDRYVLLDVRPTSPNLPFHWHLSWEALCAVGQKKGSRDAAGEEEVLFQLTRVNVAELNPCDVVSEIYFPLLNKLIER